MISTHDEQILKSVLARQVQIPDAEWQVFRKVLSYRDLEPGDYLLRAGDVPAEIGMVLTGLLEKFFETDDGHTYIKDFSQELNLVTAYSSLLLGRASHLNIRAIEPSRLLMIPFSQFKSFYARHSCWQELGRKIAEDLFIEREQREAELLVLKADERLAIFESKFPAMMERIPQYSIASYLGISPVSLSRLMTKRRKHNLGTSEQT